MSKPWAQREGETAKAYEAFSIYLRLGPKRSLDKAYGEDRKDSKKRSKAPAHWRKWSTKYQWAMRAKAWDDEQAKATVDSHADALENARDIFRNALQGVSLELVTIALGEKDGSYNQQKAIEQVLANAGLVPTRRQEITGKDGKAIETKSSGLSDEGARLIRKRIFGVDEGE